MAQPSPPQKGMTMNLQEWNPVHTTHPWEPFKEIEERQERMARMFGFSPLRSDAGRKLMAEEYGVRAVTTLLFFKEGGPQGQIVGRATEQDVREKLERYK